MSARRMTFDPSIGVQDIMGAVEAYMKENSATNLAVALYDLTQVSICGIGYAHTYIYIYIYI